MASRIETLIRSTVEKGIGLVAEHNRARLPDVPNAFLRDQHAPMHEERTIADLRVTGTIPPALEGRYLRIGPNPIDPDARGYHWFTGDGMTHALRLQGGRARWYRNRWVRSSAVSAALGEPPAPGPRNGFDTVNTNVIGHAGRTWALVEAGAYPVELSDTLETIAHDPFGGTLGGSFSAHPHRDPATGELHAICYDARELNRVWHVVVDAAGTVVRREPVTVEHGPSIHDCAITPNHVLVFDLPVTLSMRAVIGGHRFPYRWNSKHKARLGLLPRDGAGADITWLDVEPCYVFHTANAFEDEAGRVVVDVIAYDTMFGDDGPGPDATTGRLERWIADPAGTRVSRRVIDATPQEFPRHDERATGLATRWLYTVGLAGTDGFRLTDTRLFRHDLAKGTRVERDFGPGRHPGEFSFVPRGAHGAEDDGWLIGLVIDMTNETTDLVILNADDFLGEAQAIVHLPHRVPAGFHGNWIAD